MRKELHKGDVIFESSPFVHILVKDNRRTHCSNCLQVIEALQGCRSSVLCPSCELMSYCSAECLEEDRSDHRLECAIMEDLSNLPDITRITARLLLKLDEGGDLQSEALPFSQGERSFLDLLSHADKIEEEDQCARQVFDSLTELIPTATRSWQHFKQVYGKLIINSFEVSGEDDEKLGWALYLAPSILDHSCVPSAEVDFTGKNILIKSKVKMVDIDLRKIFISYIDLGETTAVRRSKLRTNYHFWCLCDRCTGIKLSWVISEPLNEGLRDVLVQENCLATAIQENARGQDKEYLSSIRCQKCSGRPVQVSQTEVVAACKACKERPDCATIREYFDVKTAVEKVLSMEEIPADAAPECLELMTGLFHPYDLTYIRTCSLAITDSIMQNRLHQAVEFGNIVLSVVRRFAPGSPALLELVTRLMRIQAELGRLEELDRLAQASLVDHYTNTEHCTQILRLRDELYKLNLPSE